MEIKHLEPAVISKLRSSSDISTVAQCVFELVCNSLDAKSTSIAVRLNLLTFKIQVIDNGDGISKENMSFLGQRYATNKCRSLVDLERHRKTYGYRGEALAGIVEMSRGVTITSRQKESQETYTKVLSRTLNSEVKLVQFRASEGTTVTVVGWLSSIPVRQQRIVPEIELEEVKIQLEKLIIINPKISFTLRNDVTGQLILNSPKTSDILTALCHLYHEEKEEFTLLKVSKSKVSIELLIKKDLSWSGKNVQYIYVNKRPVKSSKILKQVKKSFVDLNKQQTKRHPVFVMNIKCPQIYVDLMAKSYNQEVEFTCWDLVLICIEKLGKTFTGQGQEKLDLSAEAPKKKNEKENFNCGASQLFGVVQAAAFKRKSSDDNNSQPKIRKPKWRNNIMSQATDGNYDIYDSEVTQPKEPMKIKSIMKKKNALNIQVQPVIVTPNKERQFDQYSDYPRLDTNEANGKMLIMDMFLKSTQIYKNNGYIENEKNDTELTFEESNYLFENNVQDAVNGINTTMSVSVNVKRRRLNKNDINPHVEEPKEPVFRQRRLTVSQNFENRAKSTSKCVRSQKKDSKKSDNPDRLELKCSQTEMQCDYTIAIEGNDQKPKYVFRKKSEEEMVANGVIGAFRPLKICDNDHHDARIFNFGSQTSIVKHTFKKPRTPDNPGRAAISQSPYFTRKENAVTSPFFKQSHAKVQTEQPNYLPQVAAPEMHYYLPHNLQRNIYCCNPCNCFGPVCPTGFYPVVNQFQAAQSCPLINLTNQPNQKSSDQDGIKLHTDDCAKQPSNTVPNPFLINQPSKRQNIWSSLSLFSEEDKCPKNEEDHCVGQLSDLTALELSLNEIQETHHQKSESRIIMDSQNEWLKQHNEKGDKYFLNPRTGMVSVKTPTTAKTYFSFGKRLNFVPKGLSPALKEHKEVDVSLSQNAKDKLQNMILEGYGDEEMLTKWQNYISNDPKTFFEEIYKDKSEQFEPCIPTLQPKNLKVPLNYVNYDHQSFKDIQVIGQLDNKFIVALDTNCNMLVLFDQHAVHERILVEKHFKELNDNKTACTSRVTIFMPANDVSLLRLHSKYVESLGLKMEYMLNGVHVTKVPLCLKAKLDSEGGPEIVNTLVKELLERLKSIKAPAGGIPQTLQKVMNSKACRGAIKFGDAISRKECQVLLNDLSKCKLPFQCAHGRPTLTPLLNLSKVNIAEKVKKVCLSRLRLQS